MSELSIKIAEYEININDPWADDKLGRKECGAMLTSLLVGQTTALTVSVNGEWGSGKTFMLKRWQQQLVKEEYKAIYFNAWEDDFMCNPLVAIIGQLWVHLKEPDLSECVKSLKESAGTFFKQTVFNALSTATGGVVSLSEEQLKSAADKCIDNYSEQNITRQELRTRLSDLARKIKAKTNHPLVFIIDELDRCRPTFAIETLERIKHLFDIDHVVFVLGIDRKQLGESIKSVYGNIDIENYLHRFVDLDFLIPLPNKQKYFSSLWEKHQIPSYLSELTVSEGSDGINKVAVIFKNCFCELLVVHNFMLREMEQCLKTFTIFLRARKGINNEAVMYLFPALIVLKAKGKEVYKQYTQGKITNKELLDTLLPAKNHADSNDATINMVAVILLSLSGDKERAAVDSLISSLLLRPINESSQNTPKWIHELSREERTRLYQRIQSARGLMGIKGTVKTISRFIDFAVPEE
jgi:hypothetical protein